MQRSKIEWCTHTWNPVTGCLHDCHYCYARKIAQRFMNRKGNKLCTGDGAFSPICFPQVQNGICDMTSPLWFTKDLGASKTSIAPYPYGFAPTFHRYRLDEPQHIKKSATIFVGSMCDLFGEWVPDEWIKAVFEACEKAPQHRYLFLTKNPGKLLALEMHGQLPEGENIWYGTSITGNSHSYPFQSHALYNSFFSFEPLLAPISIWDSAFQAIRLKSIKWVIVGAETGNHKGKVIPKREWIADIVNQCKENNVPLFMKSSLKGIWGEPLIQEFPW